MPYQVEARPEIPCIYTKMTGIITPLDLQESKVDVINIRQDVFSHLDAVYSITDLSFAEGGFGDVLKNTYALPPVLKALQEVNIVTVSIVPDQNPWVNLARDLFRTLNMNIVSFSVVEDAIEYIQSQN